MDTIRFLKLKNMIFRKIYHRFKTAILIISVFTISFFTFSFTDKYFEFSRELDIFTSLFREINIYYVDSIDSNKLIKKGIDEMLNSLDPYTNFIPESEKDDYRFITTGQYGGIGAVIKQMGNFVVVSDPYEGYPAQKSGLIAGDVILKIDGVDAQGKKTDDVSHLLKGTPGTEVKLLVQRDKGKPFEKVLTREEIKVKSVPYYGLVRDGIGYIKLNNFTEQAGKEVGNALKDLETGGKLKAVVLDIRSNPGGLLNQAVNISNIFVDKGLEIVSTRGKIRENNRTYKAINDPVDTKIPLAILVNSSSASASEIVSGSMQDLDRAIIVGQRTYGKGLVQNTHPLSYNTQLKLTTAKYYVPSGRCIQALDYTHRNEDGSVGKIPDSLVKPFQTKAGRIVYDGGGVLPDVLTSPRKLNNISASLVSKNLIFDFVTTYIRKNAERPKDGIIKLADKDFEDFRTFIADKDYDFTTKSETSLDELKKNAQDENYYADLKNDWELLKAKLSHNKLEDVVKNKEEILSLLEEEIAGRYFYQSGKVRQALTNDQELNKAIEIISDSMRYATILKSPVKGEAVRMETIKK